MQFGGANLSIRVKICRLSGHLRDATLASALLREDTVPRPNDTFISRLDICVIPRRIVPIRHILLKTPQKVRIGGAAGALAASTCAV